MSDQTGVMIVGAEGRMGLEVRAALEGEPSLVFAGALEREGHERVGQTLAEGVELVDDPKRALEGCGVAIDFSIPTATLENLRAAASPATSPRHRRAHDRTAASNVGRGRPCICMSPAEKAGPAGHRRRRAAFRRAPPSRSDPRPNRDSGRT